jgi:hypothetical protein
MRIDASLINSTLGNASGDADLTTEELYMEGLMGM